MSDVYQNKCLHAFQDYWVDSIFSGIHLDTWKVVGLKSWFQELESSVCSLFV